MGRKETKETESRQQGDRDRDRGDAEKTFRRQFRDNRLMKDSADTQTKQRERRQTLKNIETKKRL